MLIQELLLIEASMQGALKKALKPAGTFDDVFGRNADEIADAVHDKATSKVFVVDTSKPDAAAAVKGVMSSPTFAELHAVRIIRLGGSNRAIVSNGKVYFGSYQAGRLIEHEAA